jgi:acetyl-CoA C-acetyltransferase
MFKPKPSQKHLSKSTKIQLPSIQVIGHSIVPFGELWDWSLQDLLYQAMFSATKMAIKNKQILHQSEIQAVYVANMGAGTFSEQRHLNALASEFFSHLPPAFRLESACASGGLAIVSATDALRAGRYQTVLVVGVEKMTDVSTAVATQVLATASNRQKEYGSTFPGLYALLAQAHMKKYGTTLEQLSAVAVKNHWNALDNPSAQYRRAISFEQVSSSGLVADPLRLLDCSPISDGAAAVVLQMTADSVFKYKKNKKKSVFITGQGHAQDTLDVASRKDLTQLQATIKAGHQAFQISELSPQEIEVAEVHDCFTIAEILATEDLGFFKKGSAGPAVLSVAKEISNQIKKNSDSKSNFNSESNSFLLNKIKNNRTSSQTPVINLSGGLKACGHPVGATGVKQVAYITQLLESGLFSTGLTHNVGGSGATAVVNILQSI